MSFILFLIGAYLLVAARINIGDINAEGRTVRSAGLMLMAPLVLVSVIQVFFVFLAGGDTAAIEDNFMFFVLDIGAMIISVAVAYTILSRSERTGASGSGGSAFDAFSDLINSLQNGNNDKPADDTKSETKDTKEAKPQNTQRPATPARPRPTPTPTPNNNRGRNFPSVMGTADAARYLNITETELMRLIEEGKLAAAKINYRYRISRSVLDDFIEEQKGGTSPATE